MADDWQRCLEGLELGDLRVVGVVGKIFDDAYNPTAVERYWDSWWTEK